MSTVSITNHMPSALTILKPKSKNASKTLDKKVGQWTIAPGTTKSGIEKEAFDALLKGNPAMQAYVDMKRVVVHSGDDDTVVAPEDMSNKTSEPEKPADLQNTADATSMNGKIQHKIEEKTMVEASPPQVKPDDAPKRARGRSKAPAKPKAPAKSAAAG